MGDIQLPSSGTPWTSNSPPRIPTLADLETQINASSMTDAAKTAVGYSLFNVKNADYGASGAAGDGVTDDATAIQAAIDAAEAAGGGIVFFPPGVYLSSTTLTVDTNEVILAGSGHGASRIKFADSASAVTTPLIHFTDSTQLNWCGIRDLYLDGNKANAVLSEGLLKLTNVRFFHAENLHITSSKGYGLYSDTTSTGSTSNTSNNRYHSIHARDCDAEGMKFQGEKNSMFSQLRADNNGDAGVVFEASSTITLKETTQCVVVGVKSSDNTGEGLVLDGTARYTLNGINCNANAKSGVLLRNSNAGAVANRGQISFQMSGLMCRNNATSSGACGIETDTTAVEVSKTTIDCFEIVGENSHASAVGIDIRGWYTCSLSNGIIQDVQSHGIQIQDGETSDEAANASTRISISNVTVSSSGEGGGTAHGLYLVDSVAATTRFITVTGCNFHNNATSGSNYEIEVEAAVQEVLITGCHVDATTNGNEINVGSGAEDEVTIHGCVWRGQSDFVPTRASAASTITLPVEAYNHICTLSGTAAVTGLTAAPAGTKVTLIGTSTATLVDGGNLKLSAAGLGGADDTISLVCNGTNWYEDGRSNN